jgi:beta-glucosidase
MQRRDDLVELMADPHSGDDGDEGLGKLVGQLTLEEKVRLLTGQDIWSTTPVPAIELRSIMLSDGPSGVRGPRWDEREPSLSLPSATALSSTWNRALAYDYGAALAAEASEKDVQVVLGPTINMHRSPLGGRHFEAYSEDPYLTGVIGSAVVRGLQDRGIAASPKHYVGNDSETERFTLNAVIGEQALHEVYLAPFEAVVHAGAWTVMSGYNAVNGVTMTENELLIDPLVTAWDFDGVVISDWNAVRSVRSAAGGQHLAMPGPSSAWNEALVEAVRSGLVSETQIDEKVLRVLRLARRVGALPGERAAHRSLPSGKRRLQLARDVAVQGTVLIKNEGALPLDRVALRRLAVVGDNAITTRTQGGGSATVIPASVVTPVAGLKEALGDEVVVFAQGAVVHEGLTPLDQDSMRHPETGLPGALIRFLAKGGDELGRQDRRSSDLVYLGVGGPTLETATLEFSTRYTPAVSGAQTIGIAAIGDIRLYVDGRLALQARLGPASQDVGAFMNPASAMISIDAVAGRAIKLQALVDIVHQPQFEGALAFRLGTGPQERSASESIDEAVRIAGAADAAVVVVGTNERVESEGFDRVDLSLPGDQDALVSAVAAVARKTIVVVNAGSPVLMPWYDEVHAVLIGWFGGQEMGRALADVLLGDQEPGGRLPTTWPRSVDDVPVLNTTPAADASLPYEEGVHIGYRGWVRSECAPLAPFGHGLGYTEFELSDLRVVATSLRHQEVTVVFRAHNVGSRRGAFVGQVYLSRSESAVERPAIWLAGFDRVELDANQAAEVAIALPARAFEHWAGEWSFEPGHFQVSVGTSSAAIALHGDLVLEA